MSLQPFASLLLLLLVPFANFCQSGYLDQSFGQSGTSELIIHDSLNFSLTNLGIDRSGRIFFSYDIPMEDNFRENGIRRLSPQGDLMDWELSSQFNFEFNSWEGYYFSDNKIVSKSIRPDSFPTGFKSKYIVHDLEGNELRSIEDISSSDYLYDYYYLNRNFLIDDRGRFVRSRKDGLTRFTEGGIRDESFGEDGFASFLFDEDNLDSVIYFYAWNSLHESNDKSLLATYFSYRDLEDLTFSNQNLIKFDNSGRPDRSFGNNGRLEFDELELIWEVKDFKNGYLLQGYDLYQDTCFTYSSKAIALDKNGNRLTGYGENGILQKDVEDCTDSNLWWFMPGPQDEVIAISTTWEIDEETQQTVVYNYHFIKYTEDGRIDTSFADQGLLQLDVLGNDGIADVIKDEDDNIFIMHFNQGDTIVPAHYFITKFDGDLLWNKPVRSFPKGTFTISPNPTDSEIGLFYSGEKQTDLDVFLMDALGRIVSIEKIAELNDQDRVGLWNGNLAAGTYFVKVRLPNGASIFDDKVLVIR